nr:hypothetical protein [Leuven Tombus-like virus 2]
MEVPDGGFRRGRFCYARQILYFPSILEPQAWYYEPIGTETTAAAYTNRHKPELLDGYDPKVVGNLLHFLTPYVINCRKWSGQRYVDTMWPSSKRRIYQDALDELNNGAKYKSTVQPFTKVEKKNTSKYKAPRMIQARHVSFNILLGCYIKPLEHIITKKHNLKYHYGKGSPEDISRRMTYLSDRYKWRTEGDHKTFDAHLTVELLKVFNDYVVQCFPQDKLLKKLLKETLVNNCVSRQGDRYRVKGTRMSGDVHTSFGNSAINIAILKYMLSELGVEGEVIVNGDDFIIYSNEPLNISRSKDILITLNMETDMKESVREDEQVEFCQKKLVIAGNGEKTLLSDPRKTFMKFGMTFVKVKKYTTYLLENLHGTWMMNKNNPLGCYFRDLYFETVLLEAKAFGKNAANIIKKHMKFDYDYLERQFIYSIREAAKDKQIHTKELTCSMIEAYIDILEVPRWTAQLLRYIQNLYRDNKNFGSKQLELTSPFRTIEINHQNKTIECTMEADDNLLNHKPKVKETDDNLVKYKPKVKSRYNNSFNLSNNFNYIFNRFNRNLISLFFHNVDHIT